MKNLFKIHIIKNFIIAFTLAFILTFTLTLTLVIISTSNANANMFNKFKKGFYFEKYSTAEEAKAALLELHPIGSDVGELVKTLERAGAEVEKLNDDNYKKFYPREFNKWKSKGNANHYIIKYDKASYFFVILNWIEWKGNLWTNNDNKITFINFYKGRAF